jgi:hypothetical protein
MEDRQLSSAWRPRHIPTLVKVLVLCSLALGPHPAFAVLVDLVERPANGLGVKKAGTMAKVGSSLVRVFSEHAAHVRRGPRGPFQPSDRFLQFTNGRVLVDATAATDGGELLADLKRLGLQNGAHYGSVVSGLLPVAVIDRAAALQSLQSISASPRPELNAGSVTSQGDAALRADIARATYGVDGSGVAVGVLSDSYNILGGAATDVTSGDLPAGVNVLSEYGLCGFLVSCLDEGRAMLQIVHDLAPGSDLLFHTAMGGVAQYANAITSLAAAGADVIVDDLIYLNEPMFQDGVVAQAVDGVVAGGAAYFSAAGNQARNGYESAFVDSGEDFCIDIIADGFCDPIFELVGDMHDFDPGPGVDFYQSITIPVGGSVSIAFQWDAPFGNVNTGDGPDNDHDIVLLDATGGVLLAISANDNVTTGEPWEVLQYVNDGSYGTSFNIAITFDDIDSPGLPATLLKTVVFGSGVVINDFPTNSSTSFGHANAAGAEAVGASFFLDTPVFGTAPPMLEPFSSAGGTPILFDTNGDPLPAPEVRVKPEIVAVDGVNTSFFFSDSHGGDGIPDFFGTSAAAPHAAAVAALMLDLDASLAPNELYAALEASALDMGVAGVDFDSGYGLIRADAALGSLDADGDGLPDSLELLIGTDPLLADSDGDGLSDFQEVAWDGDASDYDRDLDLNPLVVDTDRDGFGDGMEAAAEHDPRDPADSPVWGDINDSGGVDTADVMLGYGAVVGRISLTDAQKARGNVAPLVGGQPQGVFNDDFTLADLLLIQRKSLGIVDF